VIDWQSLGASLAAKLQLPPGDIRATPIPGGDINRAYRLELGKYRFFVKLNRAALLPMFDAEKAGLDAIRQSRTLRVPEVIMTGRGGEHAFIVMEFIEFAGQPDAGRLASALAAMHNCFNEQFGFHVDNTIGSTAQVNTFSDDWVDFWRHHRLGFQLALAQQNGLDSRLIDAGHRLADKLALFFATHQPRPSLLHGDLWGGNQAADVDGNPVIYDPACYYGDHEADLAMMELFGHPGERFFASYAELFPLDTGYAVRRELYNLYHVLNHANLFGGGYVAQARQMIEILLAQ
jgi:fructosamine-3-kinase